MTKSSVLIACTLLFFACSKTSNSNNSNPQPNSVDSTGLVDSCLITQPQENNVFNQTFHYDADGNLTGFNYISAHYSPYQILETGTSTFTYNPTTRLITSYKNQWIKYYTDSAENTEDHVLLYDNQNRVIADSTTNLNGIKSNITSRFVYSDQLAVMNVSDSRIDSLTIIDGNVTREAFYVINGATIYPDYTDIFAPNVNFTNPFYNGKTPANIRTFLTLIWFNDWVSKNMSDWRGEKMTWVKDSKGRVASGAGDLGTKVTFVYQ